MMTDGIPHHLVRKPLSISRGAVYACGHNYTGVPVSAPAKAVLEISKRQAATGERWSPRRLAQVAEMPKDLVYRLDAGKARYVDLKALARLCDALHCRADQILIGESGEEGGNRGAILLIRDINGIIQIGSWLL